MKKYKLIKKYPGSPKLGFIIENGYYCDQLYINPKDYPNNWQEVVEKDYEILSLSLMRSDKHYITNVLAYGEEYIKSLLNCNGNKIYSVKRL